MTKILQLSSILGFNSFVFLFNLSCLVIQIADEILSVQLLPTTDTSNASSFLFMVPIKLHEYPVQ